MTTCLQRRQLTCYVKGGVADFVERLYTVVLGRKSDPKGKQEWIDALTSHRNTGAEVAAGFFFSDEYKKQNKSNKDYVNDLYRTMLGRNCDSAGFTAWIGQLEDGVSRSGIYAGFVYSQEFNKICQDYGINRGDYSSTEERDQNAQVAAFVQRLYRNVLQRNGEVGGLNAWAGVLNRKEESGAAVAAGFILSPEYLNKKITVEDYVEMMYQTLLNRSSDPAGKRSWVNAIVDGSMRACDLISGFAGSKEFQQLCERYGIVSGAGETFGRRLSEHDPGAYALQPYLGIPRCHKAHLCTVWGRALPLHHLRRNENRADPTNRKAYIQFL